MLLVTSVLYLVLVAYTLLSYHHNHQNHHHTHCNPHTGHMTTRYYKYHTDSSVRNLLCLHNGTERNRFLYLYRTHEHGPGKYWNNVHCGLATGSWTLKHIQRCTSQNKTLVALPVQHSVWPHLTHALLFFVATLPCLRLRVQVPHQQSHHLGWQLQSKSRMWGADKPLYNNGNYEASR